MSSFAKLAKAASGTLSQSNSQDLSKENAKPLNGDQDYVLVSEDGREPDLHARGATERQPTGVTSPAPVQVGLEVPSAQSLSREGSSKVELKLDTDALAAWQDRQPHGRVTSVTTDRTDYSGLNDHSLPSRATERDQHLQRSLEEANQQHQWAMEAVIRGWESEKADLLQKLRKMTEARDTLEAELKHSENSFAGLLEGMLDQKLDQMLNMLQDCGAKPPSSRSSLSSPSALNTQPTVRKAQQVVNDLSAMLEAMKLQQAAIESRVSDMQSAVLQLLPEADSPTSKELSDRFQLSNLPASSDASSVGNRRSFVQKSLIRAGGIFNRSRGFVCTKVPALAHAAGDFAARAITAPLHYASHFSGRSIAYLHARGVKNEHLTAAAGAAAGIVATTILVRSLGPAKSSTAVSANSTENADVEEIEIMGSDNSVENDGSVEIILNRNGVFRRAGPEEPALVVAWPI